VLDDLLLPVKAIQRFDAGGKVKASVPADPENIDDHSVHLPSVEA
jgi:hypothetical protein